MITIKQYAERVGITHQAVYQLIKTHSDEVSEHITKQGRTRYLTDKAVELLDKYRQQNPVGEKQIEKDDYIKYLEGENARLIGEENSLLKKVAALESLLREQSDQIAEAKYNQLMLESKDKRIEELERVRDSQQQELDSFEKSLFGFYRKK